MSAATPEPEDLRVWRERQRSSLPTPWDDAGIRFLEDEESPQLLDTSYLTDEDLANPDVRANVRAMEETNALISWFAEEDGERAFGYWTGSGEPADAGARTGAGPVAVLDTEGQYTLLPGENLTEALCAHCADFEDAAFAVLMERSRALISETAPEVAASLTRTASIADLPNPAIAGPGTFRDARYTALREAEQGDDLDRSAEPTGARERDTDSGIDVEADQVRDPSLLEPPADLVRWRERAAAGEAAPWNRFGVRFLAEGELPGAVAKSEAYAAESGDERDRLDAEATRATAELATWVLEGDDGLALGYWHGPERTPIGAAQLVLLEPPDWFAGVPGRTLTDAMCLAFADYEDEAIAPLVQECRALGFEVTGETYADFPRSDADDAGTYRYECKKRLEERARLARAEAAAAAAAAEAERRAAASPSTAVVTGELLAVIAALGHAGDSAEAEAALALFGPPYERSQYPVGSVTRTYYVAAQKHAELIFEDGVLETVMIWIAGGEGHGAYARPESLIDGIGPSTTREQILERFGEPEWANATADRFWIAADAPGRVLLRFEYRDGVVAEISATREGPHE